MDDREWGNSMEEDRETGESKAVGKELTTKGGHEYNPRRGNKLMSLWINCKAPMN